MEGIIKFKVIQDQPTDPNKAALLLHVFVRVLVFFNLNGENNVSFLEV